MWKAFTSARVPWSLSLPETDASDIEKQKTAHELVLVSLGGPLLFDSAPTAISKRESPDFEVRIGDDRAYIEIVDAVPVGLTEKVGETEVMNLEERRSKPRSDVYRVRPEHLGRAILRVIEAKREKARGWLEKEPEMAARLMLIVNIGIAPLPGRYYFRDEVELSALVAATAIDPFVAVAAVDETGGYVWR